MVASECTPATEIGQLADVLFRLGRESEIRRNAGKIIWPKYHCMREDAVPIAHTVGGPATNISEYVRHK